MEVSGGWPLPSEEPSLRPPGHCSGDLPTCPLAGWESVWRGSCGSERRSRRLAAELRWSHSHRVFISSLKCFDIVFGAEGDVALGGAR